MTDFFQGAIESNRKLREGYYILEIRVPARVKFRPIPGQFVMLKPVSLSEPFLPRPYSIMYFRKGILTILYRVIGKGTRALSELHRGDTVNLLGPLGKGFSPPGERIAAVVGGVGIPPVVYYGTYYAARGKLRDFSVFYGGKRAEEIFFLEELNAIGASIYVSTEDGSIGYKGLVTELLESHFQKKGSGTRLISCGPVAMMRRVKEIAMARKLICEVSLETFMACGFGVCLGCAVGTASGDYVRVCMEGPVFNCSEIQL